MFVVKFLQQRYYVAYCTFCGSFKVKCPVSLAKTCIQHMNVARFYFVVSGTYWGGSEIKCLGVLLKGQCSQSSILNQLLVLTNAKVI